MPRYWITLIVLLLSAMLSWGDTALPPAPPSSYTAVARTLPPLLMAPWGPATDGLMCRLVPLADYCPGEAVSMLFQVKNVSQRTLYLPLNVMPANYPMVTFSLTDADHNTYPASTWQLQQKGATPADVHPLAPDQMISIDLVDLHGTFLKYLQNQGMIDELDVPRSYTLHFSYALKSLPADGADVYSDEVEKNAWSGTLTADAPLIIVPMSKDDLTVHEWGVFIDYHEADYANTSMKAEWASMPAYFERQFPKATFPTFYLPVSKPVIYCYTKRPALQLALTLKFGTGAPVIWWPPADPLMIGGSMMPVAPGVKEDHLRRELSWHAWLGATIPSESATVDQARPWLTVREPALEATSWLRTARVPDAAPITPSPSTWIYERKVADMHTERYLYYDGLIAAPKGLLCTASDTTSVTVKNSAAYAIGPLFLIDRRENTVRFAQLATLAAADSARITFSEIPAAQWPDAARKPLSQALRAAGLFPAEAEAMLKIWNDGLFQQPGVVACYLLPQAEYDRALPLTIEPKPAQLTRVALILQPNMQGEPALIARAQALIANLASLDSAAQTQAANELLTMGSIAQRALTAALATDADETVKTRYRHLLQQIDAADYLRTDPTVTTK